MTTLSSLLKEESLFSTDLWSPCQGQLICSTLTFSMKAVGSICQSVSFGRVIVYSLHNLKVDAQGEKGEQAIKLNAQAARTKARWQECFDCEVSLISTGK